MKAKMKRLPQPKRNEYERDRFGLAGGNKRTVESGRTQANANLIAAAPELLEILAAHLRWYEGGVGASDVDETELIAKTRAVLKKARGE